MRVPARCIQCDGRAMVYATVRHASFVVRYRRCDCCGTTSKSIQMKTFLSSNKSIDVALSAVTMRVSSTTKEIP